MSKKTDDGVIDINKLTDDQVRIAQKIVLEAQRQGVDPDYALALAYTENRFKAEGISRNKKSEVVGAIGPMQLMPATAKELKVDPHNVDQNIEGGIRYLKQNLNKFEGDKTKAAIAYNAGPNHSFFKTGKVEDIPEESVGYVSSIHRNYPLTDQASETTPTQVPESKPAESTTKQPAAQSTGQPAAQPTQPEQTDTTNKDLHGNEIVPGAPPVENPNVNPPVPPDAGHETTNANGNSDARDIVLLGGAALGAKGTAAANAFQQKGNYVNQLTGKPWTSFAEERPLFASGKRGLDAYIKSQFPEGHRIYTKQLEEIAHEIAKRGNPNAEPIKINTMSQAQKQIALIKAKEAEYDKKIIERTGRPAAKITKAISPARAAADLSKYLPNPNTPLTNKVVIQPAQAIGRGIGSVAPVAGKIGLGALGGLGAAFNALEAKKLWDEQGGHKNWRTYAKGIGALGGLGTMIPGLQAPGAAVSMIGLAPEAVDLASEYGPKIAKYVTDPKKIYERAKQYQREHPLDIGQVAGGLQAFGQ
jgi:hypothetical protein